MSFIGQQAPNTLEINQCVCLCICIIVFFCNYFVFCVLFIYLEIKAFFGIKKKIVTKKNSIIHMHKHHIDLFQGYLAPVVQ